MKVHSYIPLTETPAETRLPVEILPEEIESAEEVEEVRPGSRVTVVDLVPDGYESQGSWR